MDEDQIESWLGANLPDVQRSENLGMRFLFVGPERMMPFVTFISNADYDSVSDLDRPGVFRLNLGIGGPTFRRLFPDPDGPWDYTRLDTLMPNPDYARQHWVSILSPSEDSFRELEPLLREAHGIAAARAARTAGASAEGGESADVGEPPAEAAD